MLGGSIRLFGHIEHQNPSIIDAMGNCIMIRKKLQTTDGENMEKPITEAPPIADGMVG